MKNVRLQSAPLLIITLCSSFLLACNSNQSSHAHLVQCPQERATEMAPAAIASIANPLEQTEANINAGEKLYHSAAKPVACAECHGDRGDGNGIMADMFQPPPRNFTCAETTSPLPDGQLFWIIKYGSIGTSMPAFDKLSDQQIWQLTMYLRTLEKKNKFEDTAENKPVVPDNS